MDPIDFTEDGMALDAVRDVGPGGHFFGTPHTLERFRDAFYKPLLSDWRNYESWDEAGRPEAKEKMVELVDVFMSSYEEPPMDPVARNELEEFVERRRAEGGVATDY
jgi:trimethylamine--corrinoid protein Co-methyltransferase